jgi:hypothetical protein
MGSGNTVWPIQNDDDKLTRLVERLIDVTGVGLADQITVAGRKTLSVFAGLCERHFLHASCRPSVAGPHVPENDTDSLWIFNIPTESQLLVLVETLCRDVRPGGTVAIDLGSLSPKTYPFRLRHALAQSGSTPRQQRAVMIGQDLFLVAHKGVSLRAVAA